MNLVPFIAEKLGVEIGEEFKIKNGVSAIYKFQGSGLYTKKQTEDSYWCVCNDLTLRDILVGIAKIEKLPFEPKQGETYWCIRWSYNSGLFITSRLWDETLDTCWADKNLRNRFSTYTEAEAHKFDFYERMTGRKWKP